MLLDIKQASQKLGVSASTLYKWVSEKRIPYYKIGSLVKFRESDLEKWLDGNQVKERRLN